MIAGQIRTWPKISMISNRMRIESSIEKVRRSLHQHKPTRSRISSRSGAELFKLTQHLESQDLVNSVITDHGHHSDAGSGDELMFLSRRRVSMPDGSFNNIEDKDFFKEQHRRRKFMAQFNDSLDSATKSKPTALFDSDSDSQTTPPSSPEV